MTTPWWRSRRIQVPIVLAAVLASAGLGVGAAFAISVLHPPVSVPHPSTGGDSGQSIVVPSPGDPIPAGHVPILMYHYIRVNPDPKDVAGKVLSVTPTDFDQQMQWAHDHGYHTISLNDLYTALASNQTLDRHSVVLTFDDGYADFFSAAWPVLKKYGFTATAYIVGGFVGRPGYMTWDEVGVLDRAGINIGAHTMTHPDLTKESGAGLLAEIDGSKALIEQHLNHPVVDFCYPSGRFDSAVVNRVHLAGFRDATTTAPGAFESLASALFWPRVRVSGGETLNTFTAEVATGITTYQKYGDKPPPGALPSPFPSVEPIPTPSASPSPGVAATALRF